MPTEKTQSSCPGSRDLSRRSKGLIFILKLVLDITPLRISNVLNTLSVYYKPYEGLV
jgi:hypothetical protein